MDYTAILNDGMKQSLISERESQSSLTIYPSSDSDFFESSNLKLATMNDTMAFDFERSVIEKLAKLPSLIGVLI